MGLFEEGGDTVVTYFKRGTIANDLGPEQGGFELVLRSGGRRAGVVPFEDATDRTGGRHDDGILEDGLWADVLNDFAYGRTSS